MKIIHQRKVYAGCNTSSRVTFWCNKPKNKEREAPKKGLPESVCSVLCTGLQPSATWLATLDTGRKDTKKDRGLKITPYLSESVTTQ